MVFRAVLELVVPFPAGNLRRFIDVMRSVERIDNTVAFLIEEYGLMGIGIPQRKRQSFPPAQRISLIQYVTGRVRSYSSVPEPSVCRAIKSL